MLDSIQATATCRVVTPYCSLMPWVQAHFLISLQKDDSSSMACFALCCIHTITITRQSTITMRHPLTVSHTLTLQPCNTPLAWYYSHLVAVSGPGSMSCIHAGTLGFAYYPTLAREFQSFRVWGKVAFWTLELMDTPTYLTNQVKVGHALDQSRSVQSRGPQRAHQNNAQSWRSSKRDRRLSRQFREY